MQKGRNDDKNKVFTIPNLLSLFRLALIPVIIWLYCKKREAGWTAAVLVLSGLTDLVDGYVARRFNMVSDIGKALDPAADKLTQGAMLFCLLTRFPLMLLPLCLLVVKEIVTGILSLVVMRRKKKVYSADWHGKITTCLLYITMILHVIWFRIPATVSNCCIAACTVMMLVSFALYGLRNIKAIKS